MNGDTTILNKTITLTRGNTYNFSVNALDHPVHIQTTSNGYNVFDAYTQGVTTPSGSSPLPFAIGSFKFVVPTNAPDELYYQSQNDAVFGIIKITLL